MIWPSTDGRYELLTKKEVIRLERERKHLQANLAGIKNMKRLPDALFIVDSNNEAIAVKEARKLGIPWLRWWIPIAIRRWWITLFRAMTTRCVRFACLPRRSPIRRPRV